MTLTPRWLKPVDSLSVAFLGLLMAVTLGFHARVPGWFALSLRYAGVIALVFSAAYVRRRRPESALFRQVHDFLVLFVILFTFDSLSGLTQYVNGPEKDPALAAIDLATFGAHPGAWLQGFIHPALTDILQLCYTSYYFLPVSFCLLLYYRVGHEEYDRAVYGLTLGFFISYLGYLFVPALGPRFYLDGVFTHDLMRGHLATAINDTLNTLENGNRDAFPSGHTEIVLIMLIYAWRYRRWFFWVSLPLVSGLIMATMYLRYHYVVDVVAGAALAPVSVWAGGRLYRMGVRARLSKAGS